MPEEVFIDPTTRGIKWRSDEMYLGLHLRVAAYTPSVVVVHSRGWSTGGRSDRVYVPAQYHVFLILNRQQGVHALDQLVSFKVRLDPDGPNDAMPIPWRPFPDPATQPGNRHGPSRSST
ncbi:MAG: hypothetical protein JOZ07_07600 [Solirubrobacterales bacterium]|nr:hypothetical protein [Solirubrobacterales bacterium]